jgi:hypothetical protein
VVFAFGFRMLLEEIEHIVTHPLPKPYIIQPKSTLIVSVGLSYIKDTNAFCARSTPILSTTSSVCLKPAVSATMTGNPPISNDNSRISLVVPGTDVTMAASLCAWQQSDLDNLRVKMKDRYRGS